MILKASIAVFFSLLIQPTLMAPLKPNVFLREGEYLSGPLNQACSLLKHTPCGKEKIRFIRFDHIADVSRRKMCSNVQNVFCQVHKSLLMVNIYLCRNNPIYYIEDSQFLDKNIQCILPNDYITMKDFCLKLKDYVQMLYNIC